MSDVVEIDPTFSAIKKYGTACKTFDAAGGKGGIGRDVIDATQTALVELVYLKPRTHGGRAAKRKYFTAYGADNKPFNSLPHARKALEWLAQRSLVEGHDRQPQARPTTVAHGVC